MQHAAIVMPVIFHGRKCCQFSLTDDGGVCRTMADACSFLTELRLRQTQSHTQHRASVASSGKTRLETAQPALSTKYNVTQKQY